MPRKALQPADVHPDVRARVDKDTLKLPEQQCKSTSLIRTMMTYDHAVLSKADLDLVDEAAAPAKARHMKLYKAQECDDSYKNFQLRHFDQASRQFTEASSNLIVGMAVGAG
jgi:hypothetical protein